MNNITRTIATALATSTFLFAGPVLAEHHEEAATVEAEAESTDQAQGPAMWKVADEDTTIYLFGTVHALPETVQWLNGPISDALASSDAIVTEIIMDETTDAKMLKLVGETGMLPPDTTLRSLLDEEQTKTYEAALAKLGMPAAAFDRFEPWYAGMVLTMLPLLQQGYSPDAGVEEVLLKRAGEIDRQALETLDFQIGLFDGLPQESQIAFLVQTAGNVDNITAQLDQMVAEWLEGDADQLAVLMNEGLTDKILAEQLLFARNRNWADWIDERLEEPGTIFVAVGAGHLAGDKSVQDALEENGIVAERVH